MGESIMAAYSNEDKIGQAAAPNRRLEVSVSFGRFETDTLSWEKWSTFSQNKYMEEVEKCATPGSVAQKKAYFEAHYRKIAARKAEQLNQQKITEHEQRLSNDQNDGDITGKSCGRDSEFDISDGKTAAEGTRQEKKGDDELSNGDAVDEPNDDTAIKTEGQVSSVQIVEQQGKLDTRTLSKSEEAVFNREGDTIYLQSQVMKELSKKLNKDTESIPVINKGNLKSNPPKESQKISPLSKVRDMTRINKKQASPAAKSPQNFTTKVSKIQSTSSPLSSSTLTKKLTVSSVQKNKLPSIGQSKKVAPKSLHMSLSMDIPNSDPTPPTSTLLTATRKSFIMEQMKDKEIVKRAFKTFQNDFNPLKSSAEERSSAIKQVPARETENEVSSSITPQKENAGSFKAVSMDKKTAKAAPSSFGLKGDDRSEKRKQFSRKLEEKSKAKEAESTRLRTKPEEEKDAEIRKSRKSPNFRATSVSGFYRATKATKSPLDKVGSKTLGI